MALNNLAGGDLSENLLNGHRLSGAPLKSRPKQKRYYSDTFKFIVKWYRIIPGTFIFGEFIYPIKNKLRSGCEYLHERHFVDGKPATEALPTEEKETTHYSKKDLILDTIGYTCSMSMAMFAMAGVALLLSLITLGWIDKHQAGKTVDQILDPPKWKNTSLLLNLFDTIVGALLPGRASLLMNGRFVPDQMEQYWQAATDHPFLMVLLTPIGMLTALVFAAVGYEDGENLPIPGLAYILAGINWFVFMLTRTLGVFKLGVEVFTAEFFVKAYKQYIVANYDALSQVEKEIIDRTLSPQGIEARAKLTECERLAIMYKQIAQQKDENGFFLQLLEYLFIAPFIVMLACPRHALNVLSLGTFSYFTDSHLSESFKAKLNQIVYGHKHGTAYSHVYQAWHALLAGGLVFFAMTKPAKEGYELALKSFVGPLVKPFFQSVFSNPSPDQASFIIASLTWAFFGVTLFFRPFFESQLHRLDSFKSQEPDVMMERGESQGTILSECNDNTMSLGDWSSLGIFIMTYKTICDHVDNEGAQIALTVILGTLTGPVATSIMNTTSYNRRSHISDAVKNDIAAENDGKLGDKSSRFFSKATKEAEKTIRKVIYNPHATEADKTTLIVNPQHFGPRGIFNKCCCCLSTAAQPVAEVALDVMRTNTPRTP